MGISPKSHLLVICVHSQLELRGTVHSQKDALEPILFCRSCATEGGDLGLVLEVVNLVNGKRFEMLQARLGGYCVGD